MKVVIFGATGKTGRELVRVALDRGHEVTVLVRKPERLGSNATELRVLTGDIADRDAVASAVQGQDGVLCALGSRDLYKNTQVRTKGTEAILSAMADAKVRRLVVMSAMGVGESWKDLTFLNQLLFRFLMPAARADHEAQEAVVRSSATDWTIVRPSGLTDGAATGTFMAGENIRAKTSQITRVDVAEYMVESLVDAGRIHSAPTLTN